MRYLIVLCEILSILGGVWAGFAGEWFLVPMAFCLLIGFVFLEMRVVDGTEWVEVGEGMGDAADAR